MMRYQAMVTAIQLWLAIEVAKVDDCSPVDLPLRGETSGPAFQNVIHDPSW